MEKVYTICMVIGITVPLVMLIFHGLFDALDGAGDAVSSVLDGLLIDFDLDIGDTSIGLLPLSIHSICAGLLLFGTCGRLIYRGDNLVLTNVISVAAGYVAAVIVHTFIKKLKKVENTTYSKEQLLLFDAKVVNTILPGSFGSISVSTFDGITNSFPAKAEDPHETIRQDEIVSIVRFERNVAIVKIKDLARKYEEAQENRA